MFKEIKAHANFNERTGFGIHASRFFPALDALKPQEGGEGTVHISLLDVVTASQMDVRHPYPSILFTVWEATEYPVEFMKRLKLYDMLWVPSEWQRACSIAQGVPEEFVKVVPEGVDPEIYKPGIDVGTEDPRFKFVHVGQWQPRKSTKEICEAFIKAFPLEKDPLAQRGPVLFLSADTLFPSDEYKSTEERLKAYGILDPRIIPVHFEERAEYIRRLQNAHCFVTCARSEGWNLPLIEAMACGIPCITADFGGSTEYSYDALNVRIRELRKPHGIYGNWDVPGQWAEPDYDHLVELMRDAYENYAVHKEKALKTSEMIRTKFSWNAAAKKAYTILEELWGSMPDATATSANEVSTKEDPEAEIRAFARKHGFEIGSLRPRKAIFSVDCWPNSQAKMDTLSETIKQVHDAGYECLVTSHWPLPTPIIEQADYYVYEKKDILSGDDKPVYWRKRLDGTTEQKEARTEYHAVAGMMNWRNAVNFCRGKWDWMYHMNSDAEVDLAEWIKHIHESDKDMVCIRWEKDPLTIGGQLFAGKVELLDKLIPHITTWEEYASKYHDDRFLHERWMYKHISSLYDLNKIDFIDIEVGNRFDNADREIWDDEDFQFHFVDGPYLNIVGISRREYEVTYSNPVDGTVYGLKQKPGMWSRPKPKYYRNWTIKATLDGVAKFEHKMDLKGKRVLVSMGSKALGDTLAWMPYVDEFRKKHECHVVCAGWWQDIFDYPEIEFVAPGSEVPDVYASYSVGCFDDQPDMNPLNWRTVPLQKVAADILGLDYEPVKAKLKLCGNRTTDKPTVCFSEFSTMQNKFWNREGGWQEVVNYLNTNGYECVSVSAEKSLLQNITVHNGQNIQETIRDIANGDFYIGLNHGPAWIAYSLGKPCVFITGVSEEWNDFPNLYRIAINNEVCGIGCFNDPSLPINRSWEWCPREKNYACTREITPKMVIEQIERIRGDKDAVKKGNIEEDSIG
ncbi:MAG: autotransporter strand-loop-strand O-heptosyltransferase [Methanoregula sp.]|jgi:autotransporter strand-loop-strand O-heptosyltransferase